MSQLLVLSKLVAMALPNLRKTNASLRPWSDQGILTNDRGVQTRKKQLSVCYFQ
ncbi:uncharacterized protein J3R85_015245 [Psidium guajava]|nr:uncharacterized protein J3R85_015245 [Psidium guajava]